MEIHPKTSRPTEGNTFLNPLHILIVEDDSDVSTTLQKGFEAEGFATTIANNTKELFNALKTQSIDLITLDLGLEGETIGGLDLATQIRSQHNIPIIIVTGKDQPSDRVAGLEKGADDYITKPFLFREAAIRVRTVAQRYGLLLHEPTQEEINKRKLYVFSDYCVNPKLREMRTHEGTSVPLTETEFNILEMFVQFPQRVLTRDEILLKLRGHEWTPLDRSLDLHMARLRKKIEPKGEEAPRLIKSVRGVGYVFVGDVTRTDQVDL